MQQSSGTFGSTPGTGDGIHTFHLFPYYHSLSIFFNGKLRSYMIPYITLHLLLPNFVLTNYCNISESFSCMSPTHLCNLCICICQRVFIMHIRKWKSTGSPVIKNKSLFWHIYHSIFQTCLIMDLSCCILFLWFLLIMFLKRTPWEKLLYCI